MRSSRLKIEKIFQIKFSFKKVNRKMVKSDFATKMHEADDIKNYRVDRFILYPQHWAGYPARYALNWQKVRFQSDQATVIPNNEIGVYSFVVKPNIADHPAVHYLLYIGMVHKGNLRSRFRSYLSETNKEKARPHIYKMIERWSNYLWFYYVTVADPEEAKRLEDELIIAYLPPVNRQWPAQISGKMGALWS